MSRSTVPALKHFRGPAVLFAVLALALLLPSLASACGEEGGEDTGPLINWAKTTPATVSFEGGTGVIEVEVEDDCGVQQVYAEINGPEGFPFTVFQLLPSKIVSTYASVYRGEFQIVPNHQESSVYYGVNISVLDTNGAPANTFAGEIEVEAVPQFDEAPYVSEGSVYRTVFGGGGGTVKIGVSASDNRGLGNVYAIVTYPDNSEKEVWLEPVSFSRFESPLKLPANPGGTPQVYSVAVFAEDDIGQTTGEYAGTVTVEPKGVPNPGWLTLEPTYRLFGHVKIGAKGWRGVVLKNTAKPGSPPVSGFLRTPSPPFFLPGAGPEGVPFTLAAGEQQKFDVVFKPTAPGPQNVRLRIVRSDHGQPKFGMELFGTGVK